MSPMPSSLLPMLPALLCLSLAGDPPATSTSDPAPAASVELSSVRLERRELQANTFTWSAQESAALAQDSLGGSVLVWQSRRQQEGNYGIYARRFGPSGEALSEEVEVNQYTRGPQTSPSVALDASGSAWLAWESLGQDGDAGGIFARRFDRELASRTVEILVNEATDGHQSEVALDCDALGRALVAWTSPEGERGRALHARLLGPDGKALGPSLRIAADGRASFPAVVAHDSGGFTLVWSRADLEGRPQAIRCRRLSSEAALLGEERSHYEVEGRMPVEPVAATNARGELAAAWLVADGEDYAPHVQRFQWDAETSSWKPGALLPFADDAPGYTCGLGLDLLDDGRIVLAWTRLGGERRDGQILARVIDAADVLGEPAVLCGEHEGPQRLQIGGGARRLSAGPDGRLAFAWSGDSGGGDKSAANLTLLLPEGLELAELAAAPAVARFDEEEGAGPHEPPVSSGPPVRREDFDSTKSLGGPDFGFLGITQTPLTPPDVGMAAGPLHVVEIVNGAIAYFQENGTFQFQQAIDGPGGFWSSVGANGFIFDPEVVFDPLSQRFMAMACERSGNAFFLLAVSDDSDPNGTWFKYRFNVTPAAGDTDIDSPNIGVDSQAVYLSADFFGPDKFLVFMVQKAPLLTGGAPTTKSLLIVGSQSYGTPVMHTAAPAFYMAQAFETASSNMLRLHAITDPLGTPVDTTFDLTVPTYTQPEDPPQNGTAVRPETFEARFWSAFFRNGRLFATHHQGTTRVLQRWYEINMANWPTSGTPTLVQSGTIDPGPNVRTFFGSIGADSQGNIGLTYARSGPGEFISMARSYHLVGSPAGSSTPAVIMKASNAPDTSGRWGDYSSTVADPQFDRVFWGAHEFGQNGNWATWVGIFGPCDPPVIYCTGKVNSIGTTPAIGFVGTPSLGTNSFQLTLANSVPFNQGIYFWGPGAQSVPFFNGTLCVAPPVVRSGLLFADAAGAIVTPIPITVPEVGVARFFQFWLRDPAHPDGTGVGLSNALSLIFCP